MTKFLANKTNAALNLIFALMLVSLAAGQSQPGNQANDWLNGKWRGPAPGGGVIVVDIKVVNGDQLSGTSKLESRSSYDPEVSGKVDGDKVTLILINARTGNNARYDLTRAGAQLTGTRKGEAVVFERAK